jgi:hypothetical protein
MSWLVVIRRSPRRGRDGAHPIRSRSMRGVPVDLAENLSRLELRNRITGAEPAGNNGLVVDPLWSSMSR